MYRKATGKIARLSRKPKVHVYLQEKKQYQLPRTHLCRTCHIGGFIPADSGYKPLGCSPRKSTALNGSLNPAGDGSASRFLQTLLDYLVYLTV